MSLGVGRVGSGVGIRKAKRRGRRGDVLRLCTWLPFQQEGLFPFFTLQMCSFSMAFSQGALVRQQLHFTVYIAAMALFLFILLLFLSFPFLCNSFLSLPCLSSFSFLFPFSFRFLFRLFLFFSLLFLSFLLFSFLFLSFLLFSFVFLFPFPFPSFSILFFSSSLSFFLSSSLFTSSARSQSGQHFPITTYHFLEQHAYAIPRRERDLLFVLCI